ncbi:DUF3606 domain-containing protein [Methylobacterium nodulans]|uniref:DUF3606 domain-containing protein n=1 Tax=Methylobacterium nodulans (strain LMG 21967 / CNCM I-2342 / ORS 2060) TaxID=460265 RepID=B8IU67_METNO|nr:DUF3606 domain-containing protein [Methylobacterium nodulans]ACL55112.1 conserved hypothetical protein [Methylobacterium nodulans ORS 2060]
MADATHGRSTGDPERVLLDDADTRAFWARRLQVPIEQIEAAVEAVGDDPARVAAHLGKPWPYEESGIV